MGIDYYGVLNVRKCASKPEIRQMYRRLALQLHPAKTQEKENNRKDFYVTFPMIGEAYDVLSDDLHRAVYDQYGEEGLKSGVPGPQEYIQPYVYHGDAIRTFQEFFGTQNPFANLLDVLVHPLPLYEDGTHIGVKKKIPDVYHPLPLSLSEVYYGGFKQVLIRKRKLCETTKGEPAITVSTEVLKTIRFTSGISPGAQFRFSKAGNEAPDIIPADIVFVTEDIPHETFKREGETMSPETKMVQKSTFDCIENHLETWVKKETDEFKLDNEKPNECLLPLMPHLSTVIPITLSQALTGFTATVNTIDGRILRILITDIVSPLYEKVIPSEGLPIFGNKYGHRGELRLRFDISFPLYPFPSESRLSLQQMFLTSPSDARISKYEDKDFNRSILDEKMNKVAVKEQAPPGATQL